VLVCITKLTVFFSFSFFQSQVVEFAWTSIKEWEVDDEAMAFCFQYQRPEKNPRWVKIFTPYVSLFSYYRPHYSCTYFYVCFWTCLERKDVIIYKFYFPISVDLCGTSLRATECILFLDCPDSGGSKLS
jgi:hypothetical protein